MADRQVKYLSPTVEGKVHDKRLCDDEHLRYPEGYVIYRDLGYQGLVMPGVTVLEPYKKPKKGELTTAQKEINRAISSERVTVEHVIGGVKRCRILKDVYRNFRKGYEDVVMCIACGLHNFRSDKRLLSY